MKPLATSALGSLILPLVPCYAATAGTNDNPDTVWIILTSAIFVAAVAWITMDYVADCLTRMDEEVHGEKLMDAVGVVNLPE